MAKKPKQDEMPEPPGPNPNPQHVPIISRRLGAVFVAVLMDEAYAMDMQQPQFDHVAECLEEFILSNPEAPHEALLMQIRLKLKLAFYPDLDPRKLRLVLKLFREAVLGLNAIQRADDEAELQRLAAEEAARPKTVRDDERAVKPLRGPFEPSDFARAMPKGE